MLKVGVYFKSPAQVGWSKGWEGSPRERGYMYTYGWFTLLYGRNQHNFASNYPPVKNKFSKSPAEFLNDTLWSPLSLTSSLPSPHQIPSPRLFHLHPFFLCPGFPFVLQLGLPGFLRFPSDCYYPDSGWQRKVQSTPFVIGGWHQSRFSFISDSFFLMCICSWEHEKRVAEGFCHQSISWINQVVRPWSLGATALLWFLWTLFSVLQPQCTLLPWVPRQTAPRINISCEAQNFSLLILYRCT